MPIFAPAGAAAPELAPPRAGMDLTVCVVNWNAPDLLAACLQSLRDIRPRNAVAYEVIVIDNGSTDASLETMWRQFPDVGLIALPQNLALAAAYNQGLARGRGRYFLILNNDIVLLDDCLTRMVRCLDENTRVAAVAARLLNPDRSTQTAYYLHRLPSVRSLVAELAWLNRLWPGNPWSGRAAARDWDPERAAAMEQIPGACMMVRREAFASVGLLDSGFRFWYEDVDFCQRCQRAGWQLWYLPTARVIHHGGASVSLMAYSQTSLFRFRSLLRYAHKHFSAGRARALRLAVVVVLLLRLPLALVMSGVPIAPVRRHWRGVASTYFQILKEAVVGRWER